MTPRLWLGVGVRLLGLWELLTGLDEAAIMFSIALGHYHSSSFVDPSSVFPFVVFHLATAAILLKGAPAISVWLYPIRNEKAN